MPAAPNEPHPGNANDDDGEKFPHKQWCRVGETTITTNAHRGRANESGTRFVNEFYVSRTVLSIF